jgi:hypothetical protein|nr:MAG TPA: hypothetical protein [Caudoviricetes sp.]
MERVCATFDFEYENCTKPIRVDALFETVQDYEDTFRFINNYIDERDDFDCKCVTLVPYNEDINGDIVAVDCLVKLERVRAVRTTCRVIKYEEPKDARK